MQLVIDACATVPRLQSGAPRIALAALSAHDCYGDYADQRTLEDSPLIMTRLLGLRARRFSALTVRQAHAVVTPRPTREELAEGGCRCSTPTLARHRWRTISLPTLRPAGERNALPRALRWRLRRSTLIGEIGTDHDATAGAARSTAAPLTLSKPYWIG